MKPHDYQIDAKNAVAIIISAAVIIILLNSFAEEFLVDFGVEKKYHAGSDKISEIILMNTGLIQAEDVMAYIQFDSEIPTPDMECPEGSLSHNKVEISIDFERMSINVFCKINFPESDNYDTTIIVITSNNHSAVYPEQKPPYYFGMPAYVMLGLVLVGELFVIFYFSKSVYDKFLQLFSRHHKKIKCWKKTREKIKQAHNIKVNPYDVSILCSITHGNYTASQICADTKIIKRYVKRRIEFLQKNDILLPDKIQMYDSVKTSIRHLCD